MSLTPRRIHFLALLLLAPSVPAFGQAAPVKQTIYTDGHPAANTRVSLYNADTGSLVAGPFTTASDGTVTFPSVAPGNYVERTEIPAGFASHTVAVDPKVANQRVDLTEIVPAIPPGDRYIAIFFCLGAVFIVVYPICRYLAKTWAFRREKLIGELRGQSMIRYYKQFRAGECIPHPAGDKHPQLLCVGNPALTVDDYEKAFFVNFNRWYGRRYYIAPTVALAILALIASAWGCVNLWHFIAGDRSLESMRGLTASALSGAFVWIISDEMDRLRRHDFTSTDVYYYVFRLLLAVPFAWALTRLEITLTLGIPIAFFLGAFPTTTLFTAARRIVNQRVKLGDDPNTGALETEQLTAVGKESAERLKDEGISTISQLAYADPIDLTIRTNFDFDYLSDCVSQALLWLYLGKQLAGLSIFSLRGAYEANTLMEDLKAGNANAQKTITDICAALAAQKDADKVIISPEALQTTLYQAAYDPYTLFLVDVWNTPPGTTADMAAAASKSAPPVVPAPGVPG